MADVVIFGIKVKDYCAEYLELVVKYAKSGDCDARETRRRALKLLAINNCRGALVYLIDTYAKSGDCDAREVRKMAFDYLEKLDRGEII